MKVCTEKTYLKEIVSKDGTKHIGEFRAFDDKFIRFLRKKDVLPKGVKKLTKKIAANLERDKEFARRLSTLGFQCLADYLKSPLWGAAQERYMLSNLPKGCIVCGSEKFSLYHWDLSRLGEEDPTDMLPFCDGHWEGAWGTVRTSPHICLARKFNMGDKEIIEKLSPFYKGRDELLKKLEKMY